MLTIRLQRFGKKKQPTFRVVLTDSRNSPKSGKFKEVLGWRDPHRHTHALKRERILYWLSKGAQPSDTMHNLLVHEGVVQGPKRVVAPKAVPKEEKKDEAEEKITASEQAEVAHEGEVSGGEPKEESRGGAEEEEKESEEKERGEEKKEEVGDTKEEEKGEEESEKRSP